jgi:cullin 5
MFQNDQPTYEEKWPDMRPTILKLLNQETVTQQEYHDLFYNVYAVCQWDDKGTNKIKDSLQDDIIGFIQKAQQVKSYAPSGSRMISAND